MPWNTSLRMLIRVICPEPIGSRSGNRTTAARWARLLRSLEHRVTIGTGYAGEPAEVLIALHARRSFDAVQRFDSAYPERPLVVALTGTDLYRDLPHSRRAQRSLELATRLIVLQPAALQALPRKLHAKVRVMYQSAVPVERHALRKSRTFRVCVIANLRAVKDPFRSALAARRLPPASRIHIVHVGAALSPPFARRARLEMQRNPRYRWLGERPHWQVRRLLSRSRLLVLSSRLEGGANAISEALVASVPVLASRIPGSYGVLGKDYPGLFPVADTAALARLLFRAETEATFCAALSQACARRADLFDPDRERRAWRRLLSECTRGR